MKTFFVLVSISLLACRDVSSSPTSSASAPPQQPTAQRQESRVVKPSEAWELGVKIGITASAADLGADQKPVAAKAHAEAAALSKTLLGVEIPPLPTSRQAALAFLEDSRSVVMTELKRRGGDKRAATFELAVRLFEISMTLDVKRAKDYERETSDLAARGDNTPIAILRGVGPGKPTDASLRNWIKRILEEMPKDLAKQNAK